MNEALVPRTTLAGTVGPVRGIGVRSGYDITIRLIPAEPGTGLILHRTDLGLALPMDLSHALELPSCTAIGTAPEDATLFVEHLMAVFHMRRITDVVVEADGPEIPLLDGSARPWDELVLATGLARLPGTIPSLRVEREVRVEEGERWLCARPGPPTRFAYELQYANPVIGQESATFEPETEDFGRILAPARTFALIEEVEQARAAGLLRGGSEENCRIVYADRCSDPPTLPAEYARHKILDMLGDLYLLGRPVCAQVTGHLTGHAHNRQLLRQLSVCDTV